MFLTTLHLKNNSLLMRVYPVTKIARVKFRGQKTYVFSKNALYIYFDFVCLLE